MRVIDENTIAVPDPRGKQPHRQSAQLDRLLARRVSFLIPAVSETLRIMGRATI